MVKKGIFVSFNHFFAAQNLTLNAYLLSKIWDFKIFLDFSLMSMCTRTLINKYLNSFWKSIANHFWQQTFILKLFVSKYKLLFFKISSWQRKFPVIYLPMQFASWGKGGYHDNPAWSFPQSLKKISYTEKTTFGNNPAFLAHTTRNAGLLFGVLKHYDLQYLSMVHECWPLPFFLSLL